MFSEVVREIRNVYGIEGNIPLHAPVFSGNEKKYLNECIDTTYVSSVGSFVNQFEEALSKFTEIPYAVATVNGTAALHMALMLASVDKNSAVLTQSLTFVATANAISYCGALPLFVDSAEDNLGMSPQSLTEFIEKECDRAANGSLIHRSSKKVIRACVPMHVFGHPCRISELALICQKNGIFLIEDCAESLGSLYENGKHTGSDSLISILSFNGNKIVTTGGGGMILFKDKTLAKRAKHLTMTAKVPHQWEFYHDEVGYNYRLPNLNAALGCAQMEKLSFFIEKKRNLAANYQKFFAKLGLEFIAEPKGTRSNYWLNSLRLENREQRDLFLKEMNESGILCRPLWTLMHFLPFFKDCPRTEMKYSQQYAERLVNIPSGVII